MHSSLISMILLSWDYLTYVNAYQPFDRSNLGVTDLLNYTIPVGTTDFIFPVNQITYVPAGYYVAIPTLVVIRLWQNIISNIADSAFSGVPGVEILDLTNNNMDVIRTRMFEGLWNIRELYISSNQIHTVETGSFR